MLLRPQGEELLRLLVLVLAAEGRQGLGLQAVQEVMATHVSALWKPCCCCCCGGCLLWNSGL